MHSMAFSGIWLHSFLLLPKEREIVIERERQKGSEIGGESEGDMKKQALKIRARLDGSKK